MKFLLFTTIVIAQDPTVPVKPVEPTQQSAESQEESKPSSENINKMLDAEIRGMPQGDADVVNQILSNQSTYESPEQRLLGSGTATSTKSSDQTASSIPFTLNVQDTGLWAIVVVCLIVLVAAQALVKKRAHKAPELTMLARSMFGKEGSLAIIEVSSGLGARQLLVGLNSGSAPRLVMDLTDPQKLNTAKGGDLSVGDLSSGLQQFLSSDVASQRSVAKPSLKKKSPRSKQAQMQSEKGRSVNREILSKQTLKVKGGQMEQVVADPVDLSFEEDSSRSQTGGRSSDAPKIREIRRESTASQDVSFPEDESIWTKEFERALRKESQTDQSSYEE